MSYSCVVDRWGTKIPLQGWRELNALKASSYSLLVLPTVCGLPSAQRAKPFLGSGAITPPHAAQEEW
jgi:hypothetical protein